MLLLRSSNDPSVRLGLHVEEEFTAFLVFASRLSSKDSLCTPGSSMADSQFCLDGPAELDDSVQPSFTGKAWLEQRDTDAECDVNIWNLDC